MFRINDEFFFGFIFKKLSVVFGFFLLLDFWMMLLVKNLEFGSVMLIVLESCIVLYLMFVILFLYLGNMMSNLY